MHCNAKNNIINIMQKIFDSKKLTQKLKKLFKATLKKYHNQWVYVFYFSLLYLYCISGHVCDKKNFRFSFSINVLTPVMVCAVNSIIQIKYYSCLRRNCCSSEFTKKRVLSRSFFSKNSKNFQQHTIFCDLTQMFLNAENGLW